METVIAMKISIIDSTLNNNDFTRKTTSAVKRLLYSKRL